MPLLFRYAADSAAIRYHVAAMPRRFFFFAMLLTMLSRAAAAFMPLLLDAAASDITEQPTICLRHAPCYFMLRYAAADMLRRCRMMFILRRYMLILRCCLLLRCA